MHCKLIFCISLFTSFHKAYFALIYFLEKGYFWDTNRSSASPKFIVVNETRRFITVFTRTRHLSLSWSSSMQSTPQPYWLKIRFNIILSSMPGLSSGLFLSGFPTKNPVCIFPRPRKYYMPNPIILLAGSFGQFGDYRPHSSSCNPLRAPVTSENNLGV